MLSRLDDAVRQHAAGTAQGAMPTPEGLARGVLDVLRYTCVFATAVRRLATGADAILRQAALYFIC